MKHSKIPLLLVAALAISSLLLYQPLNVWAIDLYAPGLDFPVLIPKSIGGLTNKTIDKVINNTKEAILAESKVANITHDTSNNTITKLKAHLSVVILLACSKIAMKQLRPNETSSLSVAVVSGLLKQCDNIVYSGIQTPGSYLHLATDNKTVLNIVTDYLKGRHIPIPMAQLQ